MEKYNILIIEDEKYWFDRYCLWLDEYDQKYNIDWADSAEKGLKCLVEKLYDLVLLDLALDPENTHDRTSEAIQRYLMETGGETQYIIISSQAGKIDARDAGFKYSATDLIFKEEFIEKGESYLVKKVEEYLIRSNESQKPLNFQEKSYEFFVGSGEMATFWETRAISALNFGGVDKFQHFLKNSVLKPLAPVIPHKERSALSIHEDIQCLMGLFWSRGIGKPFFIIIFNNAQTPYTDEEARNLIEQWIGFQPEQLLNTTIEGNLKAYLFASGSLDASLFLLPTPKIENLFY